MMDVPADVSLLDWAQGLFRDNALRTRREDVRRALQLRFGRVSPEVDALIESTDTEDGLAALFDRAVTAPDETALLHADQ